MFMSHCSIYSTLFNPFYLFWTVFSYPTKATSLYTLKTELNHNCVNFIEKDA